MDVRQLNYKCMVMLSATKLCPTVFGYLLESPRGRCIYVS